MVSFLIRSSGSIRCRLRKLHKIKDSNGYEYEPIWINTKDAEARGIKHRDIVMAFSEKGKILAGAYVTERIKPGVVRMFYGGNWDPEDPRSRESLDRGGSGNVLTTNSPQSSHAYLHRIQHMMIDVCKWEGQN
ncbi:molybdopterin dinucleotide binding domain-containing protein [Chloroflexota bacterium]